MGLAHAELELKNPRKPDLSSVKVMALADTGALHLCIPEHVAVQLQLDDLQQREVETVDGTRQLCPYVGPVEVSTDGRGCYVGAVVLGTEVILGAVPMEDMDLVVIPAKQKVVPNPESPNVPLSIAK